MILTIHMAVLVLSTCTLFLDAPQARAADSGDLDSNKSSDNASDSQSIVEIKSSSKSKSTSKSTSASEVEIEIKPTHRSGKTFSGMANYYHDSLHGHKTASGELHDREKYTAAHRTLPFGTKLKVVNRRTKQSCVVKINDRGPYTRNVVIDVSKAAARQLGLLSHGNCIVDCEVLDSHK